MHCRMKKRKRKKVSNNSPTQCSYDPEEGKASTSSETKHTNMAERFSPGWSLQYYKEHMTGRSESSAGETCVTNRRCASPTSNKQCTYSDTVMTEQSLTTSFEKQTTSEKCTYSVTKGQSKTTVINGAHNDSDSDLLKTRKSKRTANSLSKNSDFSGKKGKFQTKYNMNNCDFNTNKVQEIGVTAGNSKVPSRTANTCSSYKPVLPPWPSRGDDRDILFNGVSCAGHDRLNTSKGEGDRQTNRSPKHSTKSTAIRQKIGRTKHKRRDSEHAQNVDTKTEKKSSGHLELPGFYYDEVKKRYFKILPNSNNPGFVTKESVKRKSEENKRQKLIQDLLFNKKSPSSLRSKLLKNSQKSRLSVLHQLNDRIHDASNQNRFSKVLFGNMISNLRPVSQAKVFEQPCGVYEQLEHMKFLLPTLDGSKYLCLWSLKSVLSQRMQMISLKTKVNTSIDRSVKLSVRPCDPIIQPSLSKVTTMCWAPWSPGDTSGQYLLYTTMRMFGSMSDGNCAVIRNMDPSSEGELSTVFGLSSKMTWSCAWNPHQRQFCVGTEKCGLLCDPFTRRLWELSTKNSDVLALKFSEENGHLLYSGIRKGEILTHDLRSSSTYSVSSLRHSSSISWLHLLRDNNYLLASDFSGKLCEWDLRTRHIVQEFDGYQNEYTRLPFYVDEAQQLIYAVGQDCHCRIWDLTRGHLLHTIPSPYPAVIDEIPSVTMETSILGLKSNPSLIIGARDSVHLYTF